MIFACRHCRALLPGYIQRELTPKQREYVSRHLNNCAACYRVYMDQRQLVRELSFALPRMGGELSPTLRTSVLSAMAQPARQPIVRSYQARYSLAALLLVLGLLLPLSMRNHSFSIPTPPEPERVLAQGTPVAALFTTEVSTLTATVQSNYAPMPGATDTP